MTCVVYFHHKSEGLLVPRASNLKTVLLLCRCTTPGGRSTDFSINQKNCVHTYWLSYLTCQELFTHTLMILRQIPLSWVGFLDPGQKGK